MLKKISYKKKEKVKPNRISKADKFIIEGIKKDLEVKKIIQNKTIKLGKFIIKTKEKIVNA